jgi:hypothetical protein
MQSPFSESIVGASIMPIHDWTTVPAGLFHHFHQHWSVEIASLLNRGRLPKGVDAMVEQRSGPRESDVLALERRGKRSSDDRIDGALATLPPPATRIVRRTDREFYTDRANRIVVRHHLGRILAVIEIVSPGNKDSRSALREFVEKTCDFLRAGIRVLVVDLFPPTPRDPFGMHKVIWDELIEEDFAFPPGKDRILASYETGLEWTAYVEPVGVGDSLPDMPLYLATDLYVSVPLEPAYQTAWDASPEGIRLAVEGGGIPETQDE